MASNTDILVDLPREEITILCEYYKEKQDVAPHIYSHLRTVLLWCDKESQSEKKSIRIFAPQGGPISTHGTFVSFGEFPWKIIITFTMEESCKLLYKVFSMTKRFDYKNYFLYAIHKKHIPILHKVMIERGLRNVTRDKAGLWRMNQEEAILKDPQYSKDYVLQKINPSYSSEINEVWAQRAENSEKYINILLKYNVGWGMFTKENKLIAWIIKSQLGQLSFVNVTNEHQKKGLAQALIYTLGKEIASDGFPVLATIYEINIASQKLFTKCGFKSQFTVGFLIYE